MDASAHVQFSFVNRRTDPAQYARSFEIAPQGDDFDDIQAEYAGILQRQLTKGNNGIVVNLHVQAIEQTEVIKRVKRKITDLDAMKIQEQKKAVRVGYDM